jgi:hypothetical protein
VPETSHTSYLPTTPARAPPPGTIVALSNTIGVVGVAGQGARLHHYNAFGSTDEAPDSEMFMGLVSCKNHLAALKKTSPGMRMVVSMSLVSQKKASESLVSCICIRGGSSRPYE